MTPENVLEQLRAGIRRYAVESGAAERMPPPCFVAMGGSFRAIDPAAGIVSARFSVRAEWLNPYGYVQGGFIVAAVDNTIGPLSMIVGPPSVTGRLESTFERPVDGRWRYIDVVARHTGRDGRKLFFVAEVLSPAGERCTTAEAVHIIPRRPPGS